LPVAIPHDRRHGFFSCASLSLFSDPFTSNEPLELGVLRMASTEPEKKPDPEHGAVGAPSGDYSEKTTPKSERAENPHESSNGAQIDQNEAILNSEAEEEEREGQDEATPDVEARAGPTTAPNAVWSIFSTRQKRFIVFMVAWGGTSTDHMH
jgi:hypothetical protein